jgi:hypothetical protein
MREAVNGPSMGITMPDFGDQCSAERVTRARTTTDRVPPFRAVRIGVAMAGLGHEEPIRYDIP